MADALHIRRADVCDAETIAAFNTALAFETENKKLNPQTIRSGVSRLIAYPHHGFYIVAEIEGEIAGCLMITYEWSDWRDGVFWWIQSVYVKPEFRRRGIYRALHNYIREHARADKNICGLRLYAENENVAAQKAYEKSGMSRAPYTIYEEVFRAS